MVSTIGPNVAPGLNSVGVDPRLHRQGAPAAERWQEGALPSDSIEISAASLAAARESVRGGLDQVHQALALGREAQAFLVNIQALARDGADQAVLDAALKDFAQRVDDAIARGATLAAGEDVAIHAEPGAAPVTAPGMDLRLKRQPRAGDVLQVSAEAKVSDRDLPQAAQKSLEALQASMGRLLEAARALEAHQGFLGAAESVVAANVRHDLDAEGARLLALQVRQGLEGVGARAIANAEPQSVLALFRG